MAPTAIYFARDADAGVVLQLHGRAPTAAVYVVSPRAVQCGLHGLQAVRMICKARPCGKLTGVVDADLIPISHVSGSDQFGRILHEVIIFTMLVTRCRRGSAMCSACTEPVVRTDG